VKLYPEIVLHALNKNKPVGGVRLWFLAKEFDRGNGHIPSKDFRYWLMDLGVPRSTIYRWVDQALELGLITQGEGVYKLVSWGRGAAMVGVPHLSKPVKIELDKFVNKGWLNWVWACYVERYKTVSRETLETLTGTPPRTQLERERKAGVKKTKNYARFGNPEKDPQNAVYPDKEKGYKGKYGEVVRQLPNTYQSHDEIEFLPVGRTKKANKEINALCLCGAAAETRDRLYCETYQQFKKATRSPRNPQNDLIYLKVGNHNGVVLWSGVAV
jgi:hypothetical protein